MSEFRRGLRSPSLGGAVEIIEEEDDVGAVSRAETGSILALVSLRFLDDRIHPKDAAAKSKSKSWFTARKTQVCSCVSPGGRSKSHDCGPEPFSLSLSVD